MMNYPFLDFDKLENSYSESLGILEQSFNKILVVGIGGSSQGSKAINHFLNEKRVQYVDHLNSVKINELLNNTQLDETGFIFVSKSGQTSETLTIFEYMIKKLDGNIDFSKNFYSFTENVSSPLRDLSIQKSIKTIELSNEIGGRFSIFSNNSLIPSFYFNRDLCTEFFNGGRRALEDKDHIKNMAEEDFKRIKNGKNIFAYLIYGDELIEIGNWRKQLYAESLGKKAKGVLPVVSEMPKDQHSLLQLYLDGPKNIFFEIMGMEYSKMNLINITLSNHLDAMSKALSKINENTNKYIFKDKDISKIGHFFGSEMLRVIYLAELLEVDPFTQDAVDIQKGYLN